MTRGFEPQRDNRKTGSVIERIVDTIGNGSFPRAGQRKNLTDPQRDQLRDAIVLEAHHREGRDVLITLDVKGFILHGRRESLERLCGTRIATVDEFCENPSARWGVTIAAAARYAA